MKKTGNSLIWFMLGALIQLSFLVLINLTLVKPVFYIEAEYINSVIMSGAAFALIHGISKTDSGLGKQFKQLIISNFWKDKLIFAVFSGYILCFINIKLIGFSELSLFWGTIIVFFLREVYSYAINWLNSHLQLNQLNHKLINNGGEM